MAGEDYPLEVELKAIRDWNKYKDLKGWMDAIKAIWHWPEFVAQKDKECYELHTGGWSGNEDIIGAMKENQMMWVLYWKQSTRGGHYIFEPIRKGG
jgi:hypothetical protein